MSKNVKWYQEQYQVERLIAQILQYNQVSDQHVRQILEPYKIEELNVPSFLDEIIERIQLAQTNQEKVVVIGDYDADGICATTILVDTLKRLNIETGFYIPNRLNEGYGLSTEIVTQVFDKGYSLIITVDNGVSAIEALDLAKSLSLDIIVTDHHLISEEYDFAYLLHPTLLEKRYHTLAGAGVALYLSRCLIKEIIPLHWVLAMIATIGDMVEVFAENRLIIQKGLQFLNEGDFPVIDKLFDYKSKAIDESDIAYQIVPKINAVGRLADLANANNLVRYLLSDSLEMVADFANQIKEINQKRKTLTQEALTSLNSLKKYGAIHVLIDSELHEGILGLVANQVVSQIKEPVLVVTKSENSYKASGRSPKGFNLHAYLEKIQEYCLNFGGHNQACGLEIASCQLDSFLEALHNNKADYTLVNDEENIYINASELSLELVEKFNLLKPFGIGLLVPTIQINNFQVDNCLLIKGKYVKWLSYNGLENIEAISFNTNITYEQIKDIKEIDFIGTLSINQFNGNRKVNIAVEAVILED